MTLGSSTTLPYYEPKVINDPAPRRIPRKGHKDSSLGSKGLRRSKDSHMVQQYFPAFS
jgi:hypothetical protein